MISKLFIPKLGMTMEKATIAEWRYRHGDRVEKDAPVLVIDTEKVANELEAPAAGRLVIAASVGEELPCGAVVGFVAETEEEFAEAVRQAKVDAPAGGAAQVASSNGGERSAGSATDEGPASAQSEQVKISPLARRMASERGIDLTKITGSGPGGRIVRKDIEAAAKDPGPSRRERVDGAPRAPSPATSVMQAITAGKPGEHVVARDIAATRNEVVVVPRERVDGAAPAAPGTAGGATLGAKRVREVVPLKGIRKVISDHMQLSHSVSAPVSVISEIDMSETIRFRDRLNAKERRQASTSPSPTSSSWWRPRRCERSPS
jgi:pyruvate/2-oxoglutarate dehydrogenase complex dihydrolipoamide acyltransferase (E2) component